MFVNKRLVKEFQHSIFLLFLTILLLSFPQGAFAHAVLEKASPAQDSHLQSSPKEIVLQFNERIENELYSIKVFDSSGKEVSKSITELSVDQKGVSQTLPTLADGNYTISYSVISSDGHPIKGSYLITVGEVSNEKMENVILDQDSIEGLEESLTSVIRIFYYIFLLLFPGWILWGTFTRDSEEIRTSYRTWARYLQVLFLLASLGMGATQIAGLLDPWDWNQLFSLLMGTTVGISWVLSMLLSLIGFVILFRHTWLDRVWIILILAAKSVNGHAFAHEPQILTVTIDLIHLLAAAIWSGGLFYILFYWKKQRNILGIFAKAALISIIVLIATGVASTLIYLPKLNYLFYTQWGILLLVKIALVVFVIVVGGFLRFYLKKKQDGKIGTLLKVDFSLMIGILCIVGLFTFLSPLPENKPLNWVEKGEEIEFTATISPKVPGTNVFMVEANTLEAGVKVKRMELFLINKDNTDVAPIRVPLEDYEQATNAHYMIEGQYLPFAGNWTAEVRILDSEDNEKVYRKDFIVY